MNDSFSTAELAAYLDEALPPERMAGIERQIRDRPELIAQLALINRRRDAGQHALRRIWRGGRLTCPTRPELGSYLLGALAADHAEYIAFHLQDVGCRLCISNLEDLKRQQAESAAESWRRRRRYFQSSAGCLRTK